MIRSMSIAATLLLIAATRASAADGGAISQETSGQWRASKLAGVPIYGPDNNSVGKVSDVLVNKEGQTEYVVIGVGGFLGIGEKDVAIPYNQVRFHDEPIARPANPAGFDNAMGGTSANGGVAPATTGTGAGGVPSAAALGAEPTNDTPGNTASHVVNNANGGTSAPMAHSAAYPDHGTIDMTADQLKSAPAFKFAS